MVVGALGISTAPATTRQGVNYAVSNRTLPSYVKLWDFLDRHFHYALLAKQITQGLRSDEERALAIFKWTRAHIRPTPPDWAVVDDHILHIVIRGHGLDDQMADVFTTLSTYTGVPAFWNRVRLDGPTRGLVLSFARLDGRWAVFDVANGFVFRDAQGHLASVEELAANPQLIAFTVRDLEPGGRPYPDYLAACVPLEVATPLRAELQMPWPRFWYEIRQGLKSRAQGTER